VIAQEKRFWSREQGAGSREQGAGSRTTVGAYHIVLVLVIFLVLPIDKLVSGEQASVSDEQ
jgi:hypothetical protein